MASTQQEFYHINRKVHWSNFAFLNVCDEFNVGGASNPYFQFFENEGKLFPVVDDASSNVIQHMPAVNFFSSVAQGRVNCPEVTTIAHDALRHFACYLRELIWEDIRKNEFPHLPSRQRCMWLIPSLDGVSYWLQRLGLENTDYQVVKVSVQGRFHIASEKYLLVDSEPYKVSIQKARQYWLGIVDESETQEVIFEGRVKVQEIINPKSYAK